MDKKEVGFVSNKHKINRLVCADVHFSFSFQGILDYVSGSQALYIPGAMTPTEVKFFLSFRYYFPSLNLL